MTSQIIDAHAHAWAPEETYRWVDPVTPGGVEKMVYTAENLLEDMETLGVDQSVLVATPIHGPGSPYTVDCLRVHPERFYGVVVLDYVAEDIADAVTDAFERDRVVGVRMGEADVTSSGVDRALTAIAQQSRPQVHLLVSPVAYDDVERLVAGYPEIHFVIDHLGLHPSAAGYHPSNPPYADLARVADHSNVSVKVTHSPSSEVFPFADVHDHVAFLYETFGSDRLVWGSNYIYLFKRVALRQTKDFLDELDCLSRADRRKLLGRNFAALVR